MGILDGSRGLLPRHANHLKPQKRSHPVLEARDADARKRIRGTDRSSHARGFPGTGQGRVRPNQVSFRLAQRPRLERETSLNRYLRLRKALFGRAGDALLSRPPMEAETKLKPGIYAARKRVRKFYCPRPDEAYADNPVNDGGTYAKRQNARSFRFRLGRCNNKTV